MNKKVYLALAVLVMVAMACSFGSSNTPVPAGGGGTGQQVLFQDDFSNANSGWEVGDYSAGSVGYGNGYYFVKTTSKAVNMYGAAFKSITDAVITVDAAEAGGPSNFNTGYGVICRLQTGDNADMGYYFRISGDGYFSADVASGGSFTSLLTGEKWQQSSAINQGNATNHLEVTCNGSHLKFVVNGTTVFEGNDSTYASGDVALVGTTYEDSSTGEFHFTNFVASKP
jgi:hypothetical protein